jgi:hypothetical protein
VLKNVGMICEGCSGGHHEDCAEVNAHKNDKHMCVCYWSVGPEYHFRLKQEKEAAKPVISLSTNTTMGEQVGKIDIRTAPTPPIVGLRVSKVENLSSA